MKPTPTEKEILFDACKAVWPDVYMSEKGEILLPFSFEVPCGPTRGKRREVPPLPRPSIADLPGLVANARSVITVTGATASRPAPKGKAIEELSYSYGLLWGVACALDCSLPEVLEKFDATLKKRSKSARRGKTNEQP